MRRTNTIILFFILLPMIFLNFFFNNSSLQILRISQSEKCAELKSSTNITPLILWEANGTIICNEKDYQSIQQICSDGSGGVIIAWADSRKDEGDIYAQKIDSKGNKRWGKNGTVICNADQIQEFFQICCDGSGGAISVWRDGRNGNWDLYAQRIRRNGMIQWGENGDKNGVVICNAINTKDFPRICSDGMGGAIIVWADCRTGKFDIYAQRINQNGVTQWGKNGDKNGTIICNAINNQAYPQICFDGTNNAIITWQDNRTGDWNIFAQKINLLTGTTFWGESGDKNGTIICNADNDQTFPQICCDSLGSAIITWQDDRFGSSGVDIYTQKINISDGTTQWGENGNVVCNTIERQGGLYWYDSFRMCSDGNKGVFITWQDRRIDDGDIYAQHVNFSGITEWGESGDKNGTIICNAINEQLAPQISYDGVGGVIIGWIDQRYDWMGDIYIQQINSSGEAEWNENGTVICNVINMQAFPEISCVRSKSAIITWYDERKDGMTGDIYAQCIQYGADRETNIALILPLLFELGILKSERFDLNLILLILGSIIAFTIILILKLLKKR